MMADSQATIALVPLTSEEAYGSLSHMDILLARQETLENEALAQGASRVRRKIDSAAKKGQRTQGPTGERRLMAEGMKKLELALEEMCKPKQTSGRRHTAVKWVKMVGPDVTAYLTLKAVLDTLAVPAPIARVSRLISAALLAELKARRVKQDDPRLFAYQMRTAISGNYSHMARAMSGLASRSTTVDLSDLQMPAQQRVIVGAKLLDLLMETTGLVEIAATKHPQIVGHVMRPHYRPKLMIVPTAETTEWIAQYEKIAELWHPVAMPMVVPPLRWGKGARGGYRFALKNCFDLVKRSNDLQRAALNGTDMPLVYEAINSLQHTAWVVNARVLDVVEELFASGGGIAGLPNSQRYDVPEKPLDIGSNEEARKEWKREARKVYAQNVLRRQDVLGLLKTLSIARTFREEEAFYFPYSLDFRGRMYPLPVYLQPQGDDLQRGLLKFADGKPMDASAARWLAIHGANMAKTDPVSGLELSRASLDERQEWVARHTQHILDVAAAPLNTTGWWTKMDKPFAFLAFCFEWAGFYHAAAKGESYVCALPCSMDGTCNGLQHLSAMLRDEIGGVSVNLVPSSKPRDIYSDVAERVLRSLVERLGEDPLLDAWWSLHGKAGTITRKLTKRPTMTYCYGATPFGFRGFVRDFLTEFSDKQLLRRIFGEDWGAIGHASGKMGDLIWSSLGSVVQKASEGMAWMQAVAEGIAKQADRPKHITWTVPITGFPVVQHYFLMRKETVRTLIAGSMRYPKLYLPTGKTDHKKQINAIAPNIVHSLDAAALTLTVYRAQAKGIESFQMIHDSYGTVPADCELLAQCCRLAFAQLYRDHDVVAELDVQFRAQWPDAPQPPEKGMLDISAVVASDYFFS